MERMTLNNGIQDPSMINTCLAHQVFADAGTPTPRCSFATVSVNGTNLGLYVHVEEIKPPFLARHFASAEGNLYEGTVSDFTPDYRGTFEKKTNEDAADWSDVDAVVAALQDPSDAGLAALADAVDLDRFLSFWALEVLLGHWDGYSGNRNNYRFYREPGGAFVFMPWGVDAAFHLEDDPNPFDNISNPPPSVLALTAIPNRLYLDDDWRARYVGRLKELLETVWNEDELLTSVDEMAAIVREHSLPERRSAAAADAERVRQFILKRRTEILENLTPEPPDWPAPDLVAASSGESESGKVEVRFETSWGSNKSLNPFAEGEVSYLAVDGTELPAGEPGSDRRPRQRGGDGGVRRRGRGLARRHQPAARVGRRVHHRAAHCPTDRRRHASDRHGPDRGWRVVHPGRGLDPGQLHALQRGSVDALGSKCRAGRDGLRQLLRRLRGHPSRPAAGECRQ